MGALLYKKMSNLKSIVLTILTIVCSLIILGVMGREFLIIGAYAMLATEADPSLFQVVLPFLGINFIMGLITGLIPFEKKHLKCLVIADAFFPILLIALALMAFLEGIFKKKIILWNNSIYISMFILMVVAFLLPLILSHKCLEKFFPKSDSPDSGQSIF